MQGHLPPPEQRYRIRLTLARMKLLKEWHAAQRGSHLVEKGVWEGILTVWLMSWIGWLPLTAFGAYWAYPLCILGIQVPNMYVKFRAFAHAKQRLRCDWLDLIA